MLDDLGYLGECLYRGLKAGNREVIFDDVGWNTMCMQCMRER